MAGFRGKHNHLLRRISESLLDAVLLDGLFAKWSYRCGLHGKLSVSRHEISLPKIKALPRPLTIAFASDFHAGPTTHPGIFSKLFEKIHAHQPDVLLLGGDFVSCKADYVATLADGLSRCNPPLGKYAVFGNHDLWTDDSELERQLIAAGVDVLVNRNVALPPPFDAVSICGLDDPWTGDANTSLAFKGAGAIRILLMHAPDGLLLLGDEKFDAGFAGHTHGGQIAFSDGTPIVVPHGPLCREYCHGRYEVRRNGSLVVSRGIGCSTLPIRINADPELVICALS
jgi:predicted MPP superfamily phosphohydrolase